MTKKITSDNSITKVYVNGKFEAFENKVDKKFTRFVATFTSKFKAFENKFDEKVRDQTEFLLDKMGEMLSQQLSNFYSRIDPILREIEDIRIDRELTTTKNNEIIKRIE